MTRGQKHSLVRRSHRWLGSVAAALLVVVAGSGIALQHPDWLGPVNNDPLSLAIDPLDSQHILRGTHWGVEVSTDGGLQWREVAMLAAPTDVGRIVFGPTTDTVYAMGTTTMVMSDDGGHIWQEIPAPNGDRDLGARFLDFAVSPTGQLHLLTTAGQYRGTVVGQWALVGEYPDRGRDWRQWVHDLHTGHLAGTAGRRVAEGGAWALVFLTVSGLVLHQRFARRRKA